MLETLLQELNNWFVVPGGIHAGAYSIKDGSIALPFLLDGQYFRIFGSIFNDGLHQYPASDLIDEDFTGTVWALAIPPTVKNLADEIDAWNAENKPTAFTSESFGGYSYSKATNSQGQPMGWQDVFKNRLNAWRKIGGARP